METLTAPQQTSTPVIEINEEVSFYRTEFGHFLVWMSIDDITVGMLRYMTYPTNPDIPDICDIEIRESHRGQGLGLKMIRMVEEEQDITLHTSGHYTPEGFNALATHIPVSPKSDTKKAMIGFRSMNFVHDWNRRELR